MLGNMGRTTKIALAREQLEDGIGLFLSGRYVSALTLLGASEEILSRIIQKNRFSSFRKSMAMGKSSQNTFGASAHIKAGNISVMECRSKHC